MTDDADLTDPATEIYELAQLLRNHQANPSNLPQFKALAELFGTDPGSAEYFTLLAAIRTRLTEFEALVRASPKLRPRLRDNGLNALASLAGVLSMQVAGSTWEGLRDRQITEAHVAALAGLEQYFADAYPMQRLSEPDRQALIAEMDELLAILANGRLNLDPVLVDAVSKAFRDLRLVMEKFPFFGRRAVEEKLIIIASALQEARRAAAKDTTAETLSFFERSVKVMKAVSNLVVFVGGLYQGGEVICGALGWVAKQAVENIGAVRLLTHQNQEQEQEPAGDDGSRSDGAAESVET